MSEAILDKLNKMDIKLDKLVTWKEVHIQEHKTISRDVEEIRDTLYDNPGLKSQLQTIMNGRKNVSKWRDFWLGVLKIVIGAAIVAVLMWLMLVYKKGT